MRTSVVHISYDDDGRPTAHRVPRAKMSTVAVNIPPIVPMTSSTAGTASELKDTRRVVSAKIQPYIDKHITRDAREASSLNTIFTAANYHRLFCAHDRPRWAKCNASTCLRDKHEAAQNWIKLLNGELK